MCTEPSRSQPMTSHEATWCGGASLPVTPIEETIVHEVVLARLGRRKARKRRALCRVNRTPKPLLAVKMTCETLA
jgi:hypothetical protein